MNDFVEVFKNAITWINNNKEWLFSGIGLTIVGLVFRKKYKSKVNIKQVNKAENSTLIGIQITQNEEGIREFKKDENSKVLRKERISGVMQRSYYVGEDISEDDIKAKYENGVLSLTIPKKKLEEKEHKRIQIA